MCKIISISNQKGGVGKTTTAVNLATSMALFSKKVLIIDLDPQGNATSNLGISRVDINYSTYDIFANKIPMSKVVAKTCIENLSILPASIDLSTVDLLLKSRKENEYYLENALEEIKHDFDYILIDCPSSLSILTINGILASDSILIPVQCEYFAIEGLTQLLNTLRPLQKKRRHNGKKFEIEGILLTMLDNSSDFGYKVVQEIKDCFHGKVLDHIIPRNINIQIAQSKSKSVIEYSPTSIGATMYNRLAKDLIKKYV